MRKKDLFYTEHNPFSEKFKSPKLIYKVNDGNAIAKSVTIVLFLVFLFGFLPWTQNIRGRGKVTTLNQEGRQQEINSIIGGRIAKWYVKEGDHVKKGDTILQLNEVKTEYLDAQLLQRTQEQILAKDEAIQNYRNKALNTDRQVEALASIKELKLQSIQNKMEQERLKINSDSAEIKANAVEQKIYERQLEAATKMVNQGVISQIEYERRKANLQNSQAKYVSLENRILRSLQELKQLQIEKINTIQEYLDKSSKVTGDKYSALSDAAAASSDKAKLQNVYANYDERMKLYYVFAPQDGQIGNLMNSGVNEVIKEGDFIAEIIPTNQIKAVELFIEPVDLPLIRIGQRVMFIFDGFPAIAFGGWPDHSFGIYSGKISSIESAASENGKFRLLIVEDPNQRPWPPNLRIGVGAHGIALLDDVPIYYEIWRNINGFPPNYYKENTIKTEIRK